MQLQDTRVPKGHSALPADEQDHMLYHHSALHNNDSRSACISMYQRRCGVQQVPRCDAHEAPQARTARAGPWRRRSSCRARATARWPGSTAAWTPRRRQTCRPRASLTTCATAASAACPSCWAGQMCSARRAPASWVRVLSTPSSLAPLQCCLSTADVWPSPADLTGTLLAPSQAAGRTSSRRCAPSSPACVSS